MAVQKRYKISDPQSGRSFRFTWDSQDDPSPEDLDSILDQGLKSPPLPPPPVQQIKRKEPTWGQSAISTGLRTVPSIAGSIGGSFIAPVAGTVAGGALGAGIGESLAELYEKSQGLREEFNPTQVAVQTGLGGIPFGGGKAAAGIKGLAAFAGKGAAKGALLGGASTIPTELAETGNFPSLRQIGSGTLGGGLFGGATAGLLGRVGTKGINPDLLPQKPAIDVVPPTGEIVKRPRPDWDFNELGTQPVKEPFANVAGEGPLRSQGIFNVTQKGKGKGEVTARAAEDKVKYKTVKVEVTNPKTGEIEIKSRRIPVEAGPETKAAITHGKISSENLGTQDFLEGNPLYSHVPNRLRPEAPNVTKLRDVAEGGGKAGAPAPKSKLEFIDQATHEANVAAVKAAEEAASKAAQPPVPGTLKVVRNPSKQELADLRADGWKVTNRLKKKDISGKSQGESVFLTYEPKVKAPKKGEAPANIEEYVAKLKARTKTETPAGPPTIMGAVKAIPGRIAKRVRESPLGALEPLTTSTEKRLRNMGPVGNEIADLLGTRRTLSETISGNELVKVRHVLRKFKKGTQREEVISIMNGEKPISEASSSKIADAVRLLRSGTESVADQAISSKVRMENIAGETVPFQKFKGEYFPRRYDKELFEDLPGLEEKLLRSGKSPKEVSLIMDNIRTKGERFSTAQHARELDLPGWKRDLSSLEHHFIEMGDAISRSKVLGEGDITNANSKISQLIKNAEDPNLARELVEHVLDRGKQAGPKANKAYGFLAGSQAATKLSLQSITNLSDIAGSASNLGVRSTARGIFETLTKPHKSIDAATQAGNLNILKTQLLHETKGGKWMSRLFGTNATEKFVRSVEGIAGKIEAEKSFRLAKKDPRWRKRLELFLDDDIDTVLKQDKLTPQQLDFASARASELTSGVPDKLALSKAFHPDNPLLKLPLLLKRFAFLNTKNLVTAYKSAPTPFQKAKKVATILGAYYGVGEATGDVKAIIKGLASGDIEEALEERNENFNISKYPALNRAMANLMQSALFGLVGDATESMAKRYTGKVSGTVGGPFLADLDEAALAAADIWNPGKETPDRFGKSKEFLLRRTPYVGSGLAQRIYGEKKNKLDFNPNLDSLNNPQFRTD